HGLSIDIKDRRRRSAKERGICLSYDPLYSLPLSPPAPAPTATHPRLASYVDNEDAAYAQNNDNPSAYTEDDFSDDIDLYDNGPSAVYPNDTGDAWVD
ncbi:hypothetical protein FRC12_020057, partial [Ceratobasidium sp. 428]